MRIRACYHRKMTSHNLDLNTLRLFALIFQTGNLSTAAARAGITTAGASRALARMRKLFADELFVRHSAGMTPTPRANELFPRVLDAIHQLDALTSVSVFEEQTHPQMFRFACYEENVLPMIWPALLDEKGELRNNIGFDLRPMRDNFWADLQSGFLDFVVAPVTGSRPGFHTAPVCRDMYVWVCAHSHPLITIMRHRRLTEKDLQRYRKITMQVPTHSSAVDGSCVDENESVANPEIFLRTSFYSCGLAMLQGTSLLAMAPLQFVLASQKWLDISILGRPAKGFLHEPCVIWHDCRHNDPGNQWLRSVILSHSPVYADPLDLPIIEPN